jgi:hypothetical protein
VSEAPTPALPHRFFLRSNYTCKSVPAGNGSICDMDEEEDEAFFLFFCPRQRLIHEAL